MCFTPGGIVQAEAAAQATLWWSEIGLEVWVDEGEVRVVTAEGATALRAGQTYPAIDSKR